jgi:ceramide glucosyltransferase
MPQGLAAELECGILNTYGARWICASDTIGLGFAQGKTMLWSRPVLERAGGILALAAEPAEDVAATKLIQRLGLRVRLIDAPFGQPLGKRTFGEVWKRQIRWFRLRRVTFPSIYAWEILPNAIWAMIAAAFVASELGYSPWPAVAAVAALCYGAEAMIANAARWHLNWRSPFLWFARDVLLPLLWIEGWRDESLSWRGNAMSIARDSPNPKQDLIRRSRRV